MRPMATGMMAPESPIPIIVMPSARPLARSNQLLTARVKAIGPELAPKNPINAIAVM